MTAVTLNKEDGKGYRPKILIVDDRVDNLLVLEVLLAPLGAEVIRATSGNEAIALTLEHDFSLGLFDVQMPEMDGFEVAELLHGSAKTEHLPIIFISAIYSGDYYKIKGVESGAVDFIEKPIVPEILLGKVKIFLELEKHRRSLLLESFQGIVESLSDGVMLINRAGIVQMLNSAAGKILAANGDDLINRPFGYPLSPGELQEVMIKRSSENFHVELNTSAMLWHGEEVYIVSLRDVTERKHTQIALEQTLKGLDEKNQELQSFTYTVSHDLRSPLVTIGGYAGLLEQVLGDAASKDALSFIEEIVKATHNMSNLLDHLLALSRIGRTEEPFAEVCLGSVVEEVVATMRLRFEAASVVIRVEDGFPSVVGDYLRLCQIVQNLIENSIKYMGEQSSPLIEIGIAETPQGQALFVRDNGPGILPKYHGKIFDLFSRLQKDANGSGVGLAVVKKIVELHKGKIWVESEGEGSGSTFWVQLPFLTEDAAEEL